MPKRLITALLLLSIGAAHTAAGATVLKLATIAPEGSSWMEGMRAGAKEIKARTEGRVVLKFYGGGVMGNDKKVLRKIRIGQLHGGSFVASGVAEQYPDINLYGLPLLFESLEEVDYVRERMDEAIEQGLEEAGWVNFGIAEGGMAMLMSSKPVRSLKDLERQKVWVPEGDTISYSAMEALGLSPVTLPITDVLTGLQTGLIDIIATSPVGALVFQWHTKVKYITRLPVSYLIAVLAIDKRAFNRLEPGDQMVVREVMSRIYDEFDETNRSDNDEAISALLASGLQYVEPNPEEVSQWRATVAEANRAQGKAGAFTPAMLDKLIGYLDEFHDGAIEPVASDSPP